MNEDEKITDYQLDRLVKGWSTVSPDEVSILAAEILELRNQVSELCAGVVLEAQEAPSYTHELKRIAHAIENLCVTINTPDISRIATAMERLAGCVLCNAIAVTGALEVDAG